MVTSDIDTSGMNGMLDGLSDALIGQGQGSDCSQILRDETRRLSKQIVAFTPPLKSNHGAPKASGEMAIAGELHSLFTEAGTKLIDEIGSEHGLHDINAFITRPQGDKLNLRWGTIDPTGARMAEYHQKEKNSRGKIGRRVKRSEPGKWFARYVVPTGTLEPYIKTIQKRVGRWRASWATVASNLGQQFPAWISRHFGSVNEISISNIEGLQSRTSPSVTFGSRAPGNQRQRGIIQSAVTARGKAIGKRIRLVLSGYAKDVREGIRHPRSKATQTASPEMVVVE